MPALVSVDRQSFDAGAILPDSGVESSSYRVDFRLPSTFWCKPSACSEPYLCRGPALGLSISGIFTGTLFA
jgi:hypothetical protein